MKNIELLDDISDLIRDFLSTLKHGDDFPKIRLSEVYPVGIRLIAKLLLELFVNLFSCIGNRSPVVISRLRCSRFKTSCLCRFCSPISNGLVSKSDVVESSLFVSEFLKVVAVF